MTASTLGTNDVKLLPSGKIHVFWGNPVKTVGGKKLQIMVFVAAPLHLLPLAGPSEMHRSERVTMVAWGLGLAMLY
jgi:hypothetical protein